MSAALHHRPRRQGRRYDVVVPVRFTNSRALGRTEIVLHAGFTCNISRRGMCVVSEHEAAVGSELTVELGMDGTALVVFGRVVWRRDDLDGVHLGIELVASELDLALFEWLLETGVRDQY